MKNKFLLNYNDPKLLIAVLVFFITCFLFLWEIIGYFQSTGKIVVATKLINQHTQESLRSNSPLFTVPLFGDYVPANLDDAEIKQSMLDVEVVGIMFDSKKEHSQVIIRAGGGQEKIYSIGDSLPGGAVIKRISANGVVVLHNGVLESLSLPKNELLFEAPAKPLIEDK
ncbi:type II secretion system protein N [Legionella brunensis]|uniref:General secretion pathway protein C n=1 Tax=Legionella brunensis TaxID=29422 RepID=A0A0W0S4T0_9GAMM|nr:type II secretion system protein N [Legionella brunensis]KTC78073.1 general secretion pathway protein C [Legionella brunensis]